jgi:hypothetical protein
MESLSKCPECGGPFDAAGLARAHALVSRFGIAAIVLAIVPTALWVMSLLGDHSDYFGLPARGWAVATSMVGIFSAPFAYFAACWLYNTHRGIRHAAGFAVLASLAGAWINGFLYIAAAIILDTLRH